MVGSREHWTRTQKIPGFSTGNHNWWINAGSRNGVLLRPVPCIPPYTLYYNMNNKNLFEFICYKHFGQILAILFVWFFIIFIIIILPVFMFMYSSWCLSLWDEPKLNVWSLLRFIVWPRFICCSSTHRNSRIPAPSHRHGSRIREKEQEKIQNFCWKRYGIIALCNTCAYTTK